MPYLWTEAERNAQLIARPIIRRRRVALALLACVWVALAVLVIHAKTVSGSTTIVRREQPVGASDCARIAADTGRPVVLAVVDGAPRCVEVVK